MVIANLFEVQLGNKDRLNTSNTVKRPGDVRVVMGSYICVYGEIFLELLLL